MNSHVNTLTPDDALHETALLFARAALHWQRLSHDQANWTAPDRQRELAQVFLRYHRAKLALEDLTTTSADHSA